MAYMNRLGIWGAGTPFREFGDFIQSVEKRYNDSYYIFSFSCEVKLELQCLAI